MIWGLDDDVNVRNVVRLAQGNCGMLCDMLLACSRLAMLVRMTDRMRHMYLVLTVVETTTNGRERGSAGCRRSLSRANLQTDQ